MFLERSIFNGMRRGGVRVLVQIIYYIILKVISLKKKLYEIFAFDLNLNFPFLFTLFFFFFFKEKT